jgi:hypothetical protein
MGSLSNYAENKTLELLVGKTAFATPTAYIALLTVVPTDADTGATITEASYTGYARKVTAGADWEAAVAGAIQNANVLTHAAATGGTSTVIAFALVDSGTIGAGNILGWGTCPSTVISATQTPPTWAAGALDLTLD